MPFSEEDQYEIRELVAAAMHDYMRGFEQRLAISMTKALDIVTAEQNARLRRLEEDQARLLRHLGLDKR